MSDRPDLAALFGASTTDTFLGLEACHDVSSIEASSAFIGAPSATPYGAVGAYARNGPESIRKAIASLSSNIERHNFDLGGPTFPKGTKLAVDCGDLPWSETDFASNRATIRQKVSDVVAQGVVPIVIGGDDSVPIPMLDAMADTGNSYTILQIDAHIDWREIHMDERMGLSSTMRRASEMKHIQKIIQVGARGIGSGHSSDVEDAVNWGAKFFTGLDVSRHGIEPALAEIEVGSNIIICIDIDALDPSIAPNTIGRAPGGLSYYQVLELIFGAALRGKIAAVDFVEIMPEMDIDGIGGLTVSRLVAATMGIIARQQAGLNSVKNSNADEITVLRGIPPEQRDQTAQLYDIAFGEKLALAIPKAGDRIQLLSKSMLLDYSIGAFHGTKLIGIAGFSTAQGALTGGIDYRGLLSELGWMKGNRAAVVFSLYERKAQAGELLMDGIVVDPEYRGKGVGSQLFSALMDFAKSENYSTIRLDVIDTNPGARRLYERLGFREEKTEEFEFLRGLLGFGASTTMTLKL